MSIFIDVGSKNLTNVIVLVKKQDPTRLKLQKVTTFL